MDLKETRKALKERYKLEKGNSILKLPKKELKESEKYKDDLVFKTSIPKVPKSESSRPIMELNEFPEDIDYDRYIKESLEILTNLGIK